MARKTISERTAEMLDAIRRCGAGWHSRAAIAEQLGRNRLSGADVTLLEMLIENGQVLAEQHEIDAPISQRWEYRLPEAQKVRR